MNETPQVALVAGGSGALGSAIARRLAETGYVVAVGSRRREASAEVAAGLSGGRAVELDVTSAESWRGAIELLAAEVGHPAVLVLASGHIQRGPFLESTPQEWEGMFEANTLGVCHGAAAVLPGMLKRGFGRIVAISSVTARVGCDGRAVYGATKAAVEAFCRGLAVEVAGSGVTVNCVAPGAVRTAFNSDYLRPGTETGDATLAAIPEGRFGRPEEVAEVVSSVIAAPYIQGQSIAVDGGWGIRG